MGDRNRNVHVEKKKTFKREIGLTSYIRPTITPSYMLHYSFQSHTHTTHTGSETCISKGNSSQYKTQIENALLTVHFKFKTKVQNSTNVWHWCNWQSVFKRVVFAHH